MHILLCLSCGEGILQIPREGVIAADRGGGTGILLLSEIETKYLYLYFYRAQVWSLPCLVKQLPCWFLFKLLFFLRFVFNRFVFKFRCAFCLILSLQSPESRISGFEFVVCGRNWLCIHICICLQKWQPATWHHLFLCVFVRVWISFDIDICICICICIYTCVCICIFQQKRKDSTWQRASWQASFDQSIGIQGRIIRREKENWLNET